MSAVPGGLGAMLAGATWLASTLLQTALLLLLAPLLNGVIKQAKARWQMRRGPRIWQPYWDLFKFFHKDDVRSEHASWILAVTPAIYFASALVAALLLPSATLPAPLAGAGDLLLVVGLLALGRFFLALAGLDTGSAFGGMGSSREMAFAALLSQQL